MEELPRKEILQSLPIIPNAERERKCLGLTYKQFEQMLLKEANFAKPIWKLVLGNWRIQENQKNVVHVKPSLIIAPSLKPVPSAGRNTILSATLTIIV